MLYIEFYVRTYMYVTHKSMIVLVQNDATILYACTYVTHEKVMPGVRIYVTYEIM